MPTINGFAALAASLKPRAHALVEETATNVVGRCAAHSRYDTSPGREDDPRPHMRDEWTHELESDTQAVVSNPTPQAIFNEYGTIHMTAQAMLHPAMDEERPIFDGKLGRLFE